jgi:hypothetical protein
VYKSKFNVFINLILRSKLNTSLKKKLDSNSKRVKLILLLSLTNAFTCY